MNTVATLTEANPDRVYRCTACTVGFVDGQWCGLDRQQWIPLSELPPGIVGPFYEIGTPDFSDYRGGEE